MLYRSPTPILSPQTVNELTGAEDTTVFPTGTDDHGDGRIDVYYGMADTRIGAATLHVPDVLPQGS